MALQTSGAISLNDLATEFGGNTPHAINEYYRGGGLVPDSGANSGIPTSGQIDMNDFYGGTAEEPYSYTAGALYTWGTNGDAANKFGDGFTGQNTTQLDDVVTPGQVAGGGTNWTIVGFSGESFGIGGVLKTDGKRWSWGVQTGNGTNNKYSSPVVTAGGATDWAQYPGAQGDNAGIKTNGRMYSYSTYISDGTETARNAFVEVAGSHTNWAVIASDQPGTSAIKTDGRL